MLAHLRPKDVGAQAPACTSPGALAEFGDRVGERPAPGSSFLFESRARAASPEEMAELVQGDRVGHLALHRRNTDTRLPLAGRPAPKSDAVSRPRLPLDPVLATKLINVRVEFGSSWTITHYPRHPSSEAGGRQVAGARTLWQARVPCAESQPLRVGAVRRPRARRMACRHHPLPSAPPRRSTPDRAVTRLAV